jgi:multiple sugar transport system permease protein
MVETGKKSRVSDIFYYMVVIVLTILFIGPILWMIMASIKTQVDAITLPPLIAFEPTLDAFRKIFQEEPFLRFLMNSTIVALGSTIMALIISFPAAYALARLDFRGKKELSFMILSFLMMPPIAVALPYIILMKNVHLIDTKLGLMVAHLTFNLPFAVWLLNSFIREIPEELDEAMLVDGGTRIGVLVKIILPLSKPGIASTAIFCIITSWNEFLFALFLAPMDAKTLPVAAVGLISFGNIFWGQIGAASVVIILPIFVFALMVQKHLARGLTLGAVKG